MHKPVAFVSLQTASKRGKRESLSSIRNIRILPFDTFVSCLSPLAGTVSQRVPNVPSAFLSTKHRCFAPQRIGYERELDPLNRVPSNTMPYLARWIARVAALTDFTAILFMVPVRTCFCLASTVHRRADFLRAFLRARSCRTAAHYDEQTMNDSTFRTSDRLP